MATGFASATTVPAERTRAEIEATLKRYKATSFSSGWSDSEAFVTFVADNRMVRFKIKLPDRADRKFTHVNKTWQKRSESAADALYEQAVRALWRRLLLCIKAKLESVASEIETFETAFAAHIVLPSGVTVGDWLVPQIAEAYANGIVGGRPSGEMPKMLPGATPGTLHLTGTDHE